MKHDALDVDTIEAARAGGLLGRKVVVFKSTASTNDIAWQYANNPTNNGLCILAESQSAGRGRRGRLWHSQPGQSILASLCLLDQAVGIERLTLTTAVAVAEAVSRFAGIPARIKWPNDILVGSKKLAGILVEKKTNDQKHQYVIGIGINCHQTAGDFAGCDLKLPATSLAMETDGPIDRNALVADLLASLEHWLAVVVPSASDRQGRDGFDTVVHRWQQFSALLGRHITVESNNQTFSGFCRGIDPTDGLVVQLDTGPVKIFHAGQTTIQAID